MKTSIVIATYNGSRFIKEQLESFIHQTVLPSEIVISDDGSTDSTIEQVESFIKQYAHLPIQFKMIKNDTDNHGVLGNFQNAAMNASGEYIFFCDQDDIWFPNKVERIVDIMDSHEEQVVIHNAQVFKEESDGSFHPIEKYLMNEYPFDENGLYKINGSGAVWSSFYYCLIQGMCMCVKREYLFSILPFSKGSGHDYWILFCAAADNSLMAVKDVLAYYRIHSNNTAGISEFKKKRPLHDKIRTFHRRGEESIVKQYVWYKDTTAYLGNRPISDDLIRILVAFFTQNRIAAVSKNKLFGIYDLVEAKNNGVYKVDGNIIFLHDIEFVLTHSHRSRKTFLDNIDKYLRKTEKE